MKKTLKKLTKFLWLLTAVVVLQACYPGGSIPVTDLDTTSTFYNTDHLATAPTSASIAWEVVHIEFDDGNDLEYDGKADDEILNTTLDELVKLYGEDSVIIISETMNPPNYDPTKYPGVRIVVPIENETAPYVESVYLPSVVLREKEVTYYYPGYGWWGGWWGWYGSYATGGSSSYYYYPGYPGGCYWCYGGGYYGTVTYEVGTVLVDMVDLRQILIDGVAPEDVEHSWVAVMRGLLGYRTSTEERVVSGIQQAFKQSPYLKVK